MKVQNFDWNVVSNEPTDMIQWSHNQGQEKKLTVVIPGKLPSNKDLLGFKVLCFFS